ncbi:anaphase-promoting complex subunit 2, partial [Coemansia spiralis]
MYNICGTLPDTALQAIVRQVKARDGAAAAGCRAQHAIDRLATAYGVRLRDLRQEAASGSRDPHAFEWFLGYLLRIEALFDGLTSEAGAVGTGAHEAALRLAWNALVYESFGADGASWLEEWMHLSIHCVLRIVETDPMIILGAELGSLDRDAAASLRRCCAADAPRLSRGTAAADDKLYQQVCGSEADTLCFLSGLSRGCRLLRGLSILDTTRSAVLDAAARIVGDSVKAHEQQWEESVLAVLSHNMRCAAGILDALLASPPGQTLVDHVEAQLYEQLSALRTGELFSIIVDFPDSRAAIDDLRECVAKLRNMRHVAVSL